MINVHVVVMPKETVLDPQGSAVKRSLRALGFDEVSDVRIGRRVSLQLDTDDQVLARERVREMCDTLLANGVVESYEFEMPTIDELATA